MKKKGLPEQSATEHKPEVVERARVPATQRRTANYYCGAARRRRRTIIGLMMEDNKDQPVLFFSLTPTLYHEKIILRALSLHGKLPGTVDQNLIQFHNSRPS